MDAFKDLKEFSPSAEDKDQEGEQEEEGENSEEIFISKVDFMPNTITCPFLVLENTIFYTFYKSAY
jgi:hypothetical protein